MTEIKKHQRIRWLYTKFANLCTELVSTKFEVWEGTPKDPPDVCIDNNQIGIEFIDFVHGWGKGGSVVRAREVLLNNIVKEAQKRFEQKYPSPALWATFHWSSHTRFTKLMIAKVAGDLVTLVSNALPIQANQSIEIEWDDFVGSPLENDLASIRIAALPKRITEGHWSNVDAGFVGFGAKSFEALVREKELDLPKYSNEFEATWLVIVADGSAISSTVIPDETVKSGCITSNFNRVYFFDVISNRITLLTADEK